jgi:hypothetical protein
LPDELGQVRVIAVLQDEGVALPVKDDGFPPAVLKGLLGDVFEVDPREEKRMPEGGQGPRLYKEWKLTGKVQGTGVFSTGMGPEQRITVILQGHGNSCTTSEDFTAWTLVVYGPRADYSLIGNLIPGGNADR